jgi:hypothetical protein
MNPELDQYDEAQQHAPQSMQQPQLHITMSVDEINLLFRALGELPHRISDPLIRNLMQQAQAQIEKPN